MNLLAAINENLSEKLLARLASATATPLAATTDYCGLATTALVRQLAQPTDLNELNARWDMCRQLFLSQVLTDADELLRTDMGWPDRRYHLAQNFLGPAQVATLTEAPGLPMQARALLGYLTILALATVGQHAQQANLIPAALGEWLSQQQVPATPAPAQKAAALAPAPKPVAPAPKAPVAAPSLASQKGAAPAPQPVAGVPRPVAPAPAPAPVLATATAGGSQKVKVLSVVGALALAGLASGYFLSGTPANATQQEAAAAPVAPASVTASAAPAAVAAPAEAKPAGAVEVVKAVAAPASKSAAAAKAATHAPAGPVLVDTIGNAALATYIGGGFNAAQGRYPKGEGQPLNIKLINRATLTVGINSSESLLYKRLVNPNLARPSSVALDRLAFDQGQAKLGAEGAQQLGNVATLLKTFPKAHLLVLGHATSSEAEAMRLSLQRANTAIEELVKQGISADRLQAQGLLATGVPAAPTAAEKQALRQGISLSVSKL